MVSMDGPALLVQGTTSRAGATWIATGLRVLLDGVTVIDGAARDDGRLAPGGPALLVADIDRGGAFASLVGTMMLLEAEDRARVLGFILNKFRGDPILLDSGLVYLRERFGLPTLGVVPFVRDLAVCEHKVRRCGQAVGAGLRVGIVRRSDVANYVALAWLESEAGAAVAWVERPADIEGLDLVVLPDGPSDPRVALALDDARMVEGVRNHMVRGGYLVAIGSGRGLVDHLGISGDRIVLSPVEDGAQRDLFMACLARARADRSLPDPPVAGETSGCSRAERIAEVLRGCMDLGPILAALGGALA